MRHWISQTQYTTSFQSHDMTKSKLKTLRERQMKNYELAQIKENRKRNELVNRIKNKQIRAKQNYENMKINKLDSLCKQNDKEAIKLCNSTQRR